MPDIDIFDPRAYFQRKIKELEQEMIAKQTRSAILQVNKANLDRTLETIQGLAGEQQKALQVEVASLAEARNQTLRSIESLQGELAALSAKLAALKSAQALVDAGEILSRSTE